MKRTTCFLLAIIIFYKAAAQTPIPFLTSNGKYTFVDSASMKPLRIGSYFSANLFREGLAKVQQALNGRYSFIDTTGTVKIPAYFDYASDFNNGLSKVAINYKYGLIDKSGNYVVPCKYDAIYDFYEGLAVAVLGNKYGYIDLKGKEVIPCTWDRVSSFSDGMATVFQGNNKGFINKTGKLVIPVMYQDASFFASGVAVILLDKKWGVINKTGKTIVPPKYSDAYVDLLSGPLIRVSVNDSSGKRKFGCIDKAGKVIVPFKFDLINYVTKDVMIVKQGEVVSLVNNKNIKIKTWDKIIDFLHLGQERISLLMNDTLTDRLKWSVFDTKGNEIAPDYRFDKVSPFYYGLAAVKINGKAGMIDTKGKMVMEPRYDDLSCVGLWKVKSGDNELVIYIDRAGREYYYNEQQQPVRRRN